MKIKALVLSLVFAATLLAGCAPKTQTPTPAASPSPAASPAASPAGSPSPTPKTDATTTASIVANAPAFLKAASKDGTWIICTVNDLTIDKDIIVEGKFENKGAVIRKIALYTQDDKRNVTARFTLKAPRMIVRSENTNISYGTFVGDIYVEAKGFKLIDSKVDGNIYFASDEFKGSFTKDDKSSVTKSATGIKKAQ